MPAVYTVVVSVWMINAPRMVPVRLNRPPSSEVPPMTTARIASISIHSPALLASAAEMFDAIINPATPAHNALNTYTANTIERCRTPANLLASGLTPTDSSSMPSAVRRVSRPTSANTPRLTRIATGRPSAKPAPST